MDINFTKMDGYLLIFPQNKNTIELIKPTKMASLILTSDILRVTRLRKTEIIRRVRDKDGERNETSHVPLFDIDRVIILGQPSITMPAITSLLDRGIPCFLLTARGRWRGTITPDNNLNAARRIRQYEQGTDPEFTLRIARVLVNAKIRNCRRVLQRLAANRDAASGPEYEHSMQALKEYAKMAEHAETAELARGAEGIARFYFHAWRRISRKLPLPQAYTSLLRGILPMLFYLSDILLL